MQVAEYKRSIVPGFIRGFLTCGAMISISLHGLQIERHGVDSIFPVPVPLHAQKAVVKPEVAVAQADDFTQRLDVAPLDYTYNSHKLERLAALKLPKVKGERP